jgi:hypothetical protein
VIFRFYLTGAEGDKVKLGYQGEKVKAIETTVELRETPAKP